MGLQPEIKRTVSVVEAMRLHGEDSTVSPLQTLPTWPTLASSLLLRVRSLSASERLAADSSDRTEDGRE